MRGGALFAMTAVAALVVTIGSVARADHTKEDAQATTAKLQAILHPPKKSRAKAKPKAAAVEAEAAPTSKATRTPIVDPLYAIIVHALAIPFDADERAAHLRDIPKNAKELEAHLRRIPTTPAEVDAHLRRLDAALDAQHHAR